MDQGLSTFLFECQSLCRRSNVVVGSPLDEVISLHYQLIDWLLRDSKWCSVEGLSASVARGSLDQLWHIRNGLHAERQASLTLMVLHSCADNHEMYMGYVFELLLHGMRNRMASVVKTVTMVHCQHEPGCHSAQNNCTNVRILPRNPCALENERDMVSIDWTTIHPTSLSCFFSR